jgi:hypothetical protein
MYMPRFNADVQRPKAKEEAPMSSIATTSNVTPFTKNLKQQQQKQQTAKDVIAANVQALIEQLEQGHSEGLTAYLLAMGKFHNYSFGNIMEIARQKPDATRVAGMYAWNQLGRRVKKGEKGIRILAPMIGIRRKKDSEAEKDIRTQNQPVLVGFRSAHVFDRLSRDLRPARVRHLNLATPVYCGTTESNSIPSVQIPARVPTERWIFMTIPSWYCVPQPRWPHWIVRLAGSGASDWVEHLARRSDPL